MTSSARKPLRIAIACYATVGGSGVVAAELGRALHARGHQIHFVATAPPYRIAQNREGIRFHKVVIPSGALFEYPSYGMACACILSEVAEKHGIDLFHVHYAYPHAVSGFLANRMTRGRSPAVVTTLHGTDITLAREQPCHERLVRFALEQSHGVTAVSAWLRDQTRRIFNLDSKIDVIHNFVDSEAFRPRTGAGLRGEFASADDFLLAHVSNFRPIKRPMDVVEVFRKVRAEVPARLLLVGEGPELARVREHVERCGLTPHVVFAGNRPDVAEVMAAADLFLLTSELEGFGLAALEAMSCGVPVVSTKSGGIEEVVRDGVDGILAPLGQIGALADGCLRLAREPELRARMAGEARRRAVRDFTIEKAVSAYEQGYYAVLDRQESGVR